MPWHGQLEDEIGATASLERAPADEEECRRAGPDAQDPEGVDRRPHWSPKSAKVTGRAEHGEIDPERKYEERD